MYRTDRSVTEECKILNRSQKSKKTGVHEIARHYSPFFGKLRLRGVS